MNRGTEKFRRELERIRRTVKLSDGPPVTVEVCEECEECAGTGRVRRGTRDKVYDWKEECPVCMGTGEV